MKTKQTANNRNSGFTLIELMIVIAIVGILAGIAVMVMNSSRQSAYNISAKHDLKEFLIAQEAYFNTHQIYVGSPGQTTRNDGNPSDFTVGDLMLSKGVIITVVSGDPNNPHKEGDPYTAEAKHEDGEIVYQYNVKDSTIFEK